MSEDKDLKVTDKRMFTPDGELREEYRHLERDAPPEPPSEPPTEGAATGSEVAEPPPRRAGAEPAGAAAPAAGEVSAAPPPPPLEIPGTPPGMGAPGFLDLISVLAEPAALYLGDVQLPDGRSAENLEMARLQIDLLDVLRRKTAGNLTSEENAILDDLLYRLRLRYVQKRG